ncbi:MAG: winged helix-turn-helix transcriptional regulator, partial [Nitrosopumilus sp.]|nr:winged helix-turn-helix transcriptional regulator [Nitrosopumilus sp.]
MPIILDKIDTAILKSLLKDGRKSFRQISRETGITTPTVKARYDRLVNIGFIKGVVPFFDFNKVDNNNDIIQIQNSNESSLKNHDTAFENDIDTIKKKIKAGLAIHLVCDFCEGPIYDKPKVLKFADFERFFCCNSCKMGYSEKYRGRIE